MDEHFKVKHLLAHELTYELNELKKKKTPVIMKQVYKEVFKASATSLRARRVA
jgi:hypothetical protein